MAKSFERQSPPRLPATCGSDFPQWWGDGFCDDFMNTAACSYDGGDCCKQEGANWNAFCKECKCLDPFTQPAPTPAPPPPPSPATCGSLVQGWWRDGYCDDFMNNAACGFDGGDCCYSKKADYKTFCSVMFQLSLNEWGIS